MSPPASGKVNSAGPLADSATSGAGSASGTHCPSTRCVPASQPVASGTQLPFSRWVPDPQASAAGTQPSPVGLTTVPGPHAGPATHVAPSQCSVASQAGTQTPPSATVPGLQAGAGTH